MSGVEEAVRQRDAALAEHDRRLEEYERSIGTPAERVADMRLQAVALRVSICQRLVRDQVSIRQRGPGMTTTGAVADPAPIVFSVDGGPHAAGEARRTVAAYIDGRFGEGALDVVRLLVSELVTNCVQHGGSGDGSPIEIAASMHGALVWVEVSSVGPPFEYLPRRSESPKKRGWGLHFVDTLAERWGIRAREPAAVWFEVRNRVYDQAA